MYYCQIQHSPWNGPEWESKRLKKRQTQEHTEKLSFSALGSWMKKLLPPEAECVLCGVK